MANYNYVHYNTILEALRQLAMFEHNIVEVGTSHDDVITLEKFGDEYVHYSKDGSAGSCSTLGELIIHMFVNDRMRVIFEDENGKNRYLRYWDMIYVNNPRSPFYGCIVDKESLEILVPRVGLWWNDTNHPEGIGYGLNYYDNHVLA